MTGQRIAATAIALAVILPIFMPGDSNNLISNLFHPNNGPGQDGFGADGNSGVGTGGIDAFAALRDQLDRERTINLLKVKVSSSSKTVGRHGNVQPFYLRTNVLSVFQRDGWRPGRSGNSEPITATAFPSSPGTSFQPKVVHFSADITITGLRSNPPVFGSPTALGGLDGSTRWSSQDMLLVGSRTTGGQSIHEEVAQPDPSVADLGGATTSDPNVAEWLQLPAVSAYVRTTTDQVIGKASTTYQKARAISDYFAAPKNKFTYSLQTANGDSGDDLTDFLIHRVGFCQQFAAAMAVMLRLSGVPARVVLGYAHDLPDAHGAFTVTTSDAHAWVEAYFAGLGWVPFDPTPLSGIAGGSGNDLSWAPHGKSTGTTPGSSVETPVKPKTTQTTAPTSSTAGRTGGTGSALKPTIIVAASLLAVLVVLLIPAGVRVRRRRHRLRRARHGDTDALWRELSDTATDLGYVWSSARTPRQVAGWLGGSTDRTSTSLRTLAGAVERARYSPRPEEDRPDLVHELGVVQAGLRSRRSFRERIRATLWPASLGWSRKWQVMRPQLGKSKPS